MKRRLFNLLPAVPVALSAAFVAMAGRSYWASDAGSWSLQATTWAIKSASGYVEVRRSIVRPTPAGFRSTGVAGSLFPGVEYFSSDWAAVIAAPAPGGVPVATPAPNFVSFRAVKINYALPAILFAVPSLNWWWGRDARRRRERLRAGACPDCGYSLTGNVTGRCPECGAFVAAPGAVRTPGPDS